MVTLTTLHLSPGVGHNEHLLYHWCGGGRRSNRRFLRLANIGRLEMSCGSPDVLAVRFGTSRKRGDEGALAAGMRPEATTSAFLNGGNRVAAFSAYNAANWIIRER
jgi:hypothetical protein